MVLIEEHCTIMQQVGKHTSIPMQVSALGKQNSWASSVGPTCTPTTLTLINLYKYGFWISFRKLSKVGQNLNLTKGGGVVMCMRF